MMKIPLFDPKSPLLPLRPQIQQAVDRVLDSGRFILGPEVHEFEHEFSAYVGAKYGIGVANGTDAITIALRAVGLQPGDEVIVPSFTFFASAEAVPPAGGRPVFCDIDPATFNVTAETISAALTLNTKAIIVVHLFGAPAPMPEILELARERGIAVIEDAAQAAGARLNGQPCGSFGDAATFSFFPSKNLGGFGDGGMVVTSDPGIAERVRSLRLHGSKDKRTHTQIGYNSRLDELQAAILRVLLPQLDGWNQARRDVVSLYEKAGINELASPQQVLDGSDPVYHLYVVSHQAAARLEDELDRAGVEARGYYRHAIHEQPAMAGYIGADVSLAGTTTASQHNLALPISPATTSEQVETVVAALRLVIERTS